MTHRYIKIGLTALVLVVAFTGLLWSSLREGTEYYKHVDEVMVSPEQWHDKQLQLHGFVVPGSIKQKPNTFDYIFQVENKGQVINASYTGIAPDTFFQEGAEVVLKGRLTPQGFHTDPNGIMAKCPSKYEEAKTVKKVG
jgi:cytochrome c-type biogenesis protein CcmE